MLGSRSEQGVQRLKGSIIGRGGPGRPSSEQLRARSDILSDALIGRPHQSLQLSFTALSSRAIFMFR